MMAVPPLLPHQLALTNGSPPQMQVRHVLDKTGTKRFIRPALKGSPTSLTSQSHLGVVKVDTDLAQVSTTL